MRLRTDRKRRKRTKRYCGADPVCRESSPCVDCDADDQATDGRTDARISRLRRTRGCDPRSSTRRARRGLDGNIWNESSKQLERAHTFHSSVFHPSASRHGRRIRRTATRRRFAIVCDRLEAGLAHGGARTRAALAGLVDPVQTNDDSGKQKRKALARSGKRRMPPFTKK